MDAIPDELKQRPQWVLWKWETHEGSEKRTKVPYTRGRRRADKTKPEAWASFDQVVTTFRDQPNFFSGIGYCFTADDPFCGIDLDHCIDPATQAIEPWAKNIINQIDSYSEISPSGTGLKAIVKAKLPGDRHVKLMGEDRRVELYDHGWFFTVTGQQWGTVETIGERQNAIVDIYSKLFPPDPVREVVSFGVRFEFDSDEALVEKAFAAKNGIKLAQLFAGDISDYDGDDSRADAGFCSLLAFYTEDRDQIDRIYRRTHLMRAKWDTRRGGTTYGRRTIGWAVDNSLTHYAGPSTYGLPDDYVEIEIVGGPAQLNGSSNGHHKSLRVELLGLSVERTGPAAQLRILHGEQLLSDHLIDPRRNTDRQRWMDDLQRQYGQQFMDWRDLRRLIDEACRAIVLPTQVGPRIELITPNLEAAATVGYMLEPHVLEGEGTILHGRPGSLKTYIKLIWAVSLDAGISKYWEVPRPRRSLWLNLERDRWIFEKRLREVNLLLGLPEDRALHAINARGLSLSALEQTLRQDVPEFEIEALFLDSLSRSAAAGQSLKDDDVANGITSLLSSLVPTWGAIGHPPRSTDEHVTGSGQFDNAANILTQARSKRLDRIHHLMLRQHKNNDGPGGVSEAEFWVAGFDEVGLIEFRRAQPGECDYLAEAEPEEQRSQQHGPGPSTRIQNWLRTNGPHDAKDIASGTSLKEEQVKQALKHGNGTLFYKPDDDGYVWGILQVNFN